MSEKIDLAKKYHENGYGCAQAVLAAFSKDYGLSEEAALRFQLVLALVWEECVKYAERLLEHLWLLVLSMAK